jgi:pimeloyl-ACP methyl ester carboxylesterase
MKKIFLHGLDSSGNGTKGRFFKTNFPNVLVPDFSGNLDERLDQLETLCRGEDTLLLVGSSFGGLMAACFAAEHRERVSKLILLAPALNFPGYRLPREKIDIPTYLLIGTGDIVTPAAVVVPLARKSFGDLVVDLVDEDHLLHQACTALDWPKLLGEERS